ncbi:hypothetical protein [Saccharothrix xinjiangensis]|uniref:SPP1 Gp6-like portal protein n=1 Tax=Saccharothrix xinjiangensis TaxID=204798 RepID=A0ABV9XVY0_9PSEU
MSAPITTFDVVPAPTDDDPRERATNPDIAVGLDTLDELAPDYTRAQQYFEGKVPEFFASVRLRRALARTGTAYRLNFAAIPVRAAASRIRVASITCPGNDAATKWLARQWERNELDLYMPDLILRACEYGDAYLIAWPADDDANEADQEDLADPVGVLPVPRATTDQFDEGGSESGDPIDIDVHLNLGFTTAVIYAEENPRHARFVIRRWGAGDRIRVDLQYRDRIEKYATKKGVKEARSAADLYVWVDEDDDEWPYPNPYGLLPAHHFRTARPYGTPLHREFYGAQDAIRKLIVSHMSTVDYQVAKQRWALVAGEDTSMAAATDPDEFAFDTIDVPSSRDVSDAELDTSPDSFWLLRNVKAVGAFEETGWEVFLKAAEEYMRMGAQVSETPMRFFDYARAQLPSGVSQDAIDVPFVKKLLDLITSFRATLQALFRDALVMAGFGRVPVVVTFEPPERVTGIDGWKIVLAKVEAGMPVKAAFMEAGYTKPQVDAWFGDDTQLAQRLAVLKTVAEVFQMIGAAATMQSLQPEQITELVDAVMPDVLAAVAAPTQDGDG